MQWTDEPRGRAGPLVVPWASWFGPCCPLAACSVSAPLNFSHLWLFSHFFGIFIVPYDMIHPKFYYFFLKKKKTNNFKA